jgi:hypothetical protein
MQNCSGQGVEGGELEKEMMIMEEEMVKKNEVKGHGEKRGKGRRRRGSRSSEEGDRGK